MEDNINKPYHYTLVLANNDRLYVNNDMDFDTFKKFLGSNDFIEVERNYNQRIGDATYFRPHIASYQTKSIVYVEDRTKEVMESRAKQKEYLEKLQPYKDEIKSYIFNRRMNFWWFCNITFWCSHSDKEELSFSLECLEDILNHCKKYHCKKKEIISNDKR